jgi:hypothetical protein
MQESSAVDGRLSLRTSSESLEAPYARVCFGGKRQRREADHSGCSRVREPRADGGVRCLSVRLARRCSRAKGMSETIGAAGLVQATCQRELKSAPVSGTEKCASGRRLLIFFEMVMRAGGAGETGAREASEFC